ncbi:MAG: adenosylcobinamide-phosphate synthase [Rugosibacter sp.]|jgi:adenosylcobinamide-phosphate synthase|nr:adenosylcobinamide-phosphate synthase [Rugosibacter sp.]
MALLSILAALILEQLQPLPLSKLVRSPVAQLARYLEQHLNDGVRLHGTIAWVLGAALPALALFIAFLFFKNTQPLLALLLSIGVLYLTMGFRQFSHFFTDIHLALRDGDIDQARHILAEWRGQSSDRLSSSEVARLAIERALPLANTHVFAPLLWFIILGPAGALLYRLAQLYDEYWRGDASAVNPVPSPHPLSAADESTALHAFGWFAHQAFSAMNWLPVRVTAALFAIVGNFEDAVNCWRTQASDWPDKNNGILLSSGAGAIGVQLGLPVHDLPPELEPDNERPGLGMGEEADADFMQSTVGLVWRSLVLSLLVLALVQISAWVGG